MFIYEVLATRKEPTRNSFTLAQDESSFKSSAQMQKKYIRLISINVLIFRNNLNLIKFSLNQTAYDFK